MFFFFFFYYASNECDMCHIQNHLDEQTYVLIANIIMQVKNMTTFTFCNQNAKGFYCTWLF